MEVFLLWFVFSVAVALLANKRGRSGVAWFVIAVITSPLIAAIFLLVLRDVSVRFDAPTPETHVKCPDCRELVLRDARKCKHCGCTLIPQ
ncbi:hypothetical protein [Burkholderia ubonensis]|uniref:hypothetical protein n=1 Tax=Burkholderia ubonensis TaxID=101571 RepID=UPI000F5735DD|nr:hypothetical protein [Burkholderia ubonensis]